MTDVGAHIARLASRSLAVEVALADLAERHEWAEDEHDLRDYIHQLLGRKPAFGSFPKGGEQWVR